MPDLIVIYGPPLSGKSTIATELGRSLAGKAAVVSMDHLLNEAIVQPDSNQAAEIDLVHQQLRLLVANYLKFGYHCIVEGTFVYQRGGSLANFESQIDQLLALMRMMTLRKMIVRMKASEEDLARRAKQAGREQDLALSLGIDAAYNDRYSPDFRSYNTSAHSPQEIARSILEELALVPSG
jgi:adenylate kinase family enzyme